MEYNNIKSNIVKPWPGKPEIPRRPPPILVAGEVYVRGSPEKTLKKIHRTASEGADIIVVGSTPQTPKNDYMRILREASKNYQVFADPAGTIDIETAYALGAVGWMSLTLNNLQEIPSWLRKEMAVVLIPRRLGNSRERVEELIDTARKAELTGFRKIILDPVIQPPISPGSLTGLVASIELSKRVPHPIMLGINNVYELIDADTHGSIPVLVALAIEAGASLILVSEESPKSQGAVIEAVTASALTSISIALDTPPKDYPYRLLVSKEKGWP